MSMLNSISKTGLLLALLLASGQCVRAGDLLRWGNAGDPILYTNSIAVAESLGWVVALYEDGGNGTIDAPDAVGNDDILRHITTFGSAGGDGYFYEDWTNPAGAGVNPGASVYTRIFNAVSIASATLYANIGSVLNTIPAYNNDPPNTGGYYSPNDPVTASSWQVVPEPGALALMTLGGAALFWLRRKRSALLTIILASLCISAGAAAPQVVGFDHNGNLMFQGAAASNYYSLEFAPTASGPWTNWGAVTEQPITGAVMTAPVPVYYRVRQMDAGSYPQYATGTPLYAESDPYWNQEKGNYATGMPLYSFSEADPQWQAEKAGYATGTPVYAETDPKWLSESGVVWSAINSKQPLGNYATGTPLYAESDPAWTAEKTNIVITYKNITNEFTIPFWEHTYGTVRLLKNVIVLNASDPSMYEDDTATYDFGDIPASSRLVQVSGKLFDSCSNEVWNADYGKVVLNIRRYSLVTGSLIQDTTLVQTANGYIGGVTNFSVTITPPMLIDKSQSAYLLYVLLDDQYNTYRCTNKSLSVGPVTLKYIQ